jgi:predicted Rdx family selenoprotein
MTQKQQQSRLFLSWWMPRQQWMSRHLLHTCQQQMQALLL